LTPLLVVFALITIPDVPWINAICHPAKTAKTFHIDVDPLKQQMPVFYLDAVSRYRADSYTAITQLTNYVSTSLAEQLTSQTFSQKWDALADAHSKRLATIAKASEPKEDGSFGTGHLCATLRKIVPEDTIFAIEAVTNTGFVSDNIQASLPGTWINCGGGGLGWSGGGSLGIKLASEHENPGKGKFVVQIVGDGTFLFSVPGSVYWISQRYKIPVLTIVLNNKGKNDSFKMGILLTSPRLECTKEIALAGPPRRLWFQGDK